LNPLFGLGPRAGAKEVCEIAGVGGIEEETLEGGKGMGRDSHAEGVSKADQVLMLWFGQRCEGQAGEVDKERTRVYESLHGPPPVTAYG
jgi:hypothetical protein